MECQHVSYQYPHQTQGLHDLTGTFPPGQVTTIIGPNGAGKSTLLNLLAQRLPIQAGQILLDQHPVTQLKPKALAQQVAMVTQRHQLYDELTVREVVATGRLPYHGLLQAVPPTEVTPYLAQSGLTDLADMVMQDLSGGQQQRVWLAAALAQEPSVLLLDEPTTYLDVHYQQVLMTQLRQLAARGMTVIQVLHDINQAFRESDWLWLLQAGKLVASGTPTDLRDATLLAQAFATPIEIVDVPQLGPYIVQIPE
ncbi:ABC transporter ATP-binding protein [Levilactobacillus yiduensis]|uniref:ABC transporter ATP-binding protein n=1 Tax=Levilactobacillus yiduensis TaxID=2953880 RepID=UPI000EF310B0|nr:ABC transporter ATP-binding protein [Levilactobacillus yiduensis]AYM03708.1 ABC transporter ATP-binding protein [Levilactobacillus brevis]